MTRSPPIGVEKLSGVFMNTHLWMFSKFYPIFLTSLCYLNQNTIVPSKFQSCLVPRDCDTTSWSSWSSCPNPCRQAIRDAEVGTVYKERKRSITVAPLGGGTLCPKLVERLPCPEADDETRLECPRSVLHISISYLHNSTN